MKVKREKMKKIFFNGLVALILVLAFSQVRLGQPGLQKQAGDYVERTKSFQVTSNGQGTFSGKVTTLGKVVRDQKTGKILKVTDFGQPEVHVDGYKRDFRHGGFNVNRKSERSVRLSTTGQFIISRENFSVGKDLVPYSIHWDKVTEPVTLVVNMSW